MFSMSSKVELSEVMKSVVVHPTSPISTTITTVAVPTSLEANDVLIKIHAAASNPKDWIHLVSRGFSLNSGDDLAGVVAALGSDVTSLQIGVRVAAFHPMGQPYGAYAEYATAPEHTIFKIPESMTFEEASTIPLVSLTAAITLFRRQGFAAPWKPEAADKNDKPLLVYAATSALGTFTIRLAKLAGIGPIIAIGGGSSAYLSTLLDMQDVLLDYRSGMDKVKQDVRQVVEDRKLSLTHAVDAFSENGSWVDVSQMMDGGILSVFSGANKYDDAGIPGNVQVLYTYVGTGHDGAYKPGMPKQPSAEDAQEDVDFAVGFFKWLEMVLRQGKFSGHPFEVIPGGLDGVAEGLNRLRDGQVRGRKLVYQIPA
ncbi:chaperonin 10-like protein [Exophiala viscosa]|uniref:chaperonin 10-like protein n=1 Tax=Exophiala viscosa TaxID=2486360 RepID=UPI00218C9C22|nr:chaperonin 10-like protein [Exophiala viscosa]